MSRNKTERFAENRESPYVIEIGKPLFESIRGKWRTLQFENDHPLVLEIACGKGEYTIGLAREFPKQNFVGIDIKGDRIWVGNRKAMTESLKNAAFLRTQVHFLDRFFEDSEVDDIWLTFPDPRPKKSDERRRLSHPRFMELYRKVMKPTGWFHFKTDNTGLFEYTLSLFEEKKVQIKNLQYTFDLYNSEMQEEHFGIVTKYEKIWSDKGSDIKYMKFQFDYD